MFHRQHLCHALPSPSDRPAPSTEAGCLQKLESFEGILCAAEFDLLECRLRLRAAVLGWTGNALRQPPSVVLAEMETILRERPARAPGRA